ncbi:hypothetical protein MRX96_022031 [Rhipicephalus microplus]
MGPHDPRCLIAAVVGKKKGRATFAMKRGLLCEPEARKAFQDKNDSHVELEEECRQISVPFDQSFFTEFIERCKFFTSSYLLPYISSNW